MIAMGPILREFRHHWSCAHPHVLSSQQCKAHILEVSQGRYTLETIGIMGPKSTCGVGHELVKCVAV